MADLCVTVQQACKLWLKNTLLLSQDPVSLLGLSISRAHLCLLVQAASQEHRILSFNLKAQSCLWSDCDEMGIQGGVKTEPRDVRAGKRGHQFASVPPVDCHLWFWLAPDHCKVLTDAIRKGEIKDGLRGFQ